MCGPVSFIRVDVEEWLRDSLQEHGKLTMATSLQNISLLHSSLPINTQHAVWLSQYCPMIEYLWAQFYAGLRDRIIALMI